MRLFVVVCNFCFDETCHSTLVYTIPSLVVIGPTIGNNNYKFCLRLFVKLVMFIIMMLAMGYMSIPRF